MVSLNLPQDSYTKEDTIFVQIASYRDPELQHTLQDLFKKAKRPENIFVGICHQYDMKGDEDNHLFTVPFPRKNQIRIDAIDYRQSNGCCFARNRSQKLWKNEKWTLMIDSHSRFKENWDEILVCDIKKINKGSKVLFTGYPHHYNPEDNITNFPELVYLLGIKLNSSTLYNSNTVNFVKIKHPVSTSYPYQGFVFFDSFFMNESLFIEDAKFFDELPFLLKIFTHGGITLLYDKNVVNHFWINNEDRSINVSRSKTILCDNNTKKIIDHLFMVKKSNCNNIKEIVKKFNLGKTRTLRDYERFSGLDFRKMKYREHSKQGIFQEWQEVSNIQTIKKIFQKI
ncbi:MAG: hypothetical protein FJX30_05195 [Alphaproteobacteria bacterium]|nr:hypothetical protein [Alphaproteobacteria bacterium]